MIKTIFILLFIVLHVEANISLEDIGSKPQSRAKNFMIWQYLKQDITPSQADKAYSQVEGKNNKILKLYLKKSSNKEIEERIACRKKKNLLSMKDDRCLKIAFSPYKTLSLTKAQREELAKKKVLKDKISLLEIQSEPNNQKNYIKYDSNTILTLFLNSPKKYRRNKLNIHLNEEFINYISSSWKISQFIKVVVHDDELNRLQLALLNLNGEKLSSMSNFYLALNHLKHLNNEEAIEHFKLSQFKAKRKIDVDKNNFWIYQVSKDKKYLNKLLQSKDINIYTLYAYEKQMKKFSNYFITLDITKKKKTTKNIQDPFEWLKISKEIKNCSRDELLKLSKDYTNLDMQPVQALIQEKIYGYNKHSYIMPYDIYLKDISIDDKALVYAIMKQESQLIPAALSRSFALGLMQIMPFVVDDLSKRMKNPIKKYDEMFIPQTNINYALAHLNWMQKSLYHPLFMAYAYNGGMGFFKRYLLENNFNSGKYEPFMSMEMMANSESREYGKKVLANYVMYKRILGEEISIVLLFDNLKYPKKTDRFREQG